MNKLFHVLNIVFFTVGITLFIFGSPVVVRADSFQPVVNPGTSSISCQFIKVNDPTNIRVVLPLTTGGPYSVYFYSIVGNRVEVDLLSFNIDVAPSISPNNNYTLYNYQYYYQGVNHTVYYYVGGDSAYYTTSGQYQDNVVISSEGTRVFNVNFSDRQECQRVVNHFLFGVGSLDYELGQVDIEDSDLDIKGLSAFILNDFKASPDFVETSKNLWKNFVVWSMNRMTGQIFDDSVFPSDLDDSVFTAGTLKNIVPGIALSWLSPTLDNDIVYNIWIDGRSDINYKTSLSPIDNFFNTQQVSTITYGKLKINDGSLTQNPSVFYQYNTAQATPFLLDYIENNSSFSLPDTVDKYNYVSLETKISRVYIQASTVVSGNNHVGALSYIDIVGGVPIVHEVETTIDDVPVSDPSSGTPAIVGTTTVVSGDTIYGGDTYYDNSTTNNYDIGLTIGGSNSNNPLDNLDDVKKLFSAIFELVESLYLTNLIKWIFVGFTGNPLGDLIL